MVDRDQAIEYALKEARDNDVKFIRLWFADILGNLKGFCHHRGGVGVGSYQRDGLRRLGD